MDKDIIDKKIRDIEVRALCAINGHFFGLDKIYGFDAEFIGVYGTHSFTFKCAYCGIKYEKYINDLTSDEKKIVPEKPKRDNL